MDKQFIPYELALELKILGFDEECIAKYVKYNEGEEIKLYPQSQNFFKGSMFDTCQNSNHKVYENCTAPLWQQVFDWFRDNKQLIVQIYYFSETHDWFTYIISSPENHFEFFPIEYNLDTDDFSELEKREVIFKNYEEARSGALKQMIKIYKKQQNK